ncbi:family 1 glycosylhydrolase [Flavobacterium sp. SUN052]|uniref:family 1 glycosylhydrolase n=1 Tax=Flavobacterium sp. SUN052 TaxID=3002441 RepID=UPI00237DDD35|nr:family 1 glycosylhydrolase [Flavobacterium sp. SUN052]MEC4005484.1 family 1 glycosylhydrolase [Flavobacterium sp. SUN052]
MIAIDEFKEELQEFHTQGFSSDFLLGLSLNEKKEYSAEKLDNNLIELTSKSNLEQYKLNILKIKQLGLLNFRFSLSWNDIMPDGVGLVNETKIDFYHQILDFCLDNNIEPFVTLFDFNLPEALEKKGGWSNREILNWFENYIKICVDAFNLKVKHWIVLNQSSIFLKINLVLDKHFLNEKWLNNFLPTLHNTILCQSLGNKIIKAKNNTSQVGIIFSSHYIVPKTFSEKDLKAADRIDIIFNRLFLEPSIGMGYPVQTIPCLKKISKYFLNEDTELLKADFDFIAIQNCKPIVVEHDLFVPFINARIVKINTNLNNSVPLEFELETDLIYRIIKKYSNYEAVKKIFIIENDLQPNDETCLSIENELSKKLQVKTFLQQILNAKNNGGKVDGYFLSFFNNFTQI